MKRISLVCILLITLALSACTAAADPQPRGRFQGEIEVGQAASRATISFSISEDGDTLEFLSIIIEGVDCEYLSAQKLSSNIFIGIPIQKGVFSQDIPPTSGELVNYVIKDAVQTMPDMAAEHPSQLRGSFSSPTEASGEIRLFLYIPTWGAFELGTFKWSASAE